MDLLKIVFTVLIVLFPLGELGRFEFYDGISTTVNDVLAVFLFAVWLIWLIFKKKFGEVSKRELAKPIFIFVFVASSSLLLNIKSLNLPEFLVSFLYLLRFISYAGIYFVVSGFDLGFKRRILMIMIFSGMLIVLGGFAQYFFYPNLRNLYYLGWDEHLYRLFASFLDPNFAASIISLFLILALSILLSGFNVYFKTRHSGLTRVSKRLEILDAPFGTYRLVHPFGLTRMTQRIFLVLISIFAFVALLLTYSRSGYLMFFVSATFLLLMFGKKKYVVILLLVFIIGIIILPKNLGGEGVKLLRTASLISRSEYLKNAVIIFKDHPILGVGFNSYRYVQHRYGFIDDSSLRASHAGAGTDNSFLFVLATTGVVGLTFYLYMWFKIIKSCQHDTKKESFQKTISTVVIASSIGLFVNAFFINSLFYPSIMLWMWILIGLNSSRSSEFKENR